MFKHILIATDGSELAERAVALGVGLAKALNATVTAITVTEPWTAFLAGEAAIAFPVDEYDRGAAADAARILAATSEIAKKQDVACVTAHIKDQFPAEGIVAACKSQGCDLIVMASHGRRGLAQLLLGSQATKVLTMSTAPVLICR
jgi:nucleotide-binding universal stress UspA family protein